MSFVHVRVSKPLPRSGHRYVKEAARVITIQQGQNISRTGIASCYCNYWKWKQRTYVRHFIHLLKDNSYYLLLFGSEVERHGDVVLWQICYVWAYSRAECFMTRWKIWGGYQENYLRQDRSNWRPLDDGGRCKSSTAVCSICAWVRVFEVVAERGTELYCRCLHTLPEIHSKFDARLFGPFNFQAHIRMLDNIDGEMYFSRTLVCFWTSAEDGRGWLAKHSLVFEDVAHKYMWLDFCKQGMAHLSSWRVYKQFFTFTAPRLPQDTFCAIWSTCTARNCHYCSDQSGRWPEESKFEVFYSILVKAINDHHFSELWLENHNHIIT